MSKCIRSHDVEYKVQEDDTSGKYYLDLTSAIGSLPLYILRSIIITYF
jgi:hypothetical protein